MGPLVQLPPAPMASSSLTTLASCHPLWPTNYGAPGAANYHPAGPPIRLEGGARPRTYGNDGGREARQDVPLTTLISASI